MVRSRPRWQMTTRSRVGAGLGVACLAVAGVQLALLSSPPTAFQIAVVAFWSVVGLAYLASAVGQRIRLRRRASVPPPVPRSGRTDVADVVPVPVRPARPRPRPSPAAGPPTPEETTDVFTVRTARPPNTSTVSFGPVRGTTVPPRSDRTEVRRPRPARPAGGAAPTVTVPAPAGPRHRAPEIPAPRGARHRAPTAEVPGRPVPPVLAGRGHRPGGR